MDTAEIYHFMDDGVTFPVVVYRKVIEFEPHHDPVYAQSADGLLKIWQ